MTPTPKDTAFQPAFSEEHMNMLVLEVYEYVKNGTLSKLKVIGVARELIEKRENGELIFYDIRVEGEKKPIHLDTMIGRIRIIIQNWKVYIAPLMETLLIEAAYKHAVKAKDSPASFKTAASVIMPERSGDNGNKPPLSPGAVAILQQNPVGTTIHLGKDAYLAREGDSGHECLDTGNIMADGQRQDITPEALPIGHGKAIHGVREGGDTAQGSPVPDTEVPSEDPVDNDGGDNMGSTE